jgi:hypothetical protein
MWKHFGHMLKSQRGYTEGQDVKDFAVFLSNATAGKYFIDLLFNYAVVADWLDIAEDCIAIRGPDNELKQAFMSRIQSIEMKRLFDSWT